MQQIYGRNISKADIALLVTVYLAKFKLKSETQLKFVLEALTIRNVHTYPELVVMYRLKLSKQSLSKSISSFIY